MTDRHLALAKLGDTILNYPPAHEGCIVHVQNDSVEMSLGIVSRTTWHKEKRANAYDFPLEAVSRTGETGDDAGSGSPQPADTHQETDQQ